MRLQRYLKITCVGSIIVALAGCGGSSSGEMTTEIDRLEALEQFDAAVAEIERVAGDPFFDDPGLPAIAAADLPTNASTTYSGVGYLDYYQETVAGNTTSRETVTVFLGEANVTVDFGAVAGEADVTGSVSNLFAGRGSSIATSEFEAVAGAITLTDRNDAGQGLNANYSFDLNAFGRGFSGNGIVTGDIVQDGATTAVRLTDYDVATESDLPNLAHNLVIVAEE